MSDPAKYRTKEEVESYKDRDPLIWVKQTILENKWMTEKELTELDKKVKAQVQDCVKFAEESPDPDPQELYEDVYYQSDYPFVNY
jgi:pyruvate dehydrogenase E1 component alpha subunit